MKKLPRELRKKLIRASELPPLEPAEIHCYCYDCAHTAHPYNEYIVEKVEPYQPIYEQCEVCKRMKGIDWRIQKRRSPLKPYR